MRAAFRSRVCVPLLTLVIGVGCGGRTDESGFGSIANDAGLGGFAGSPGGYTGNAGYTGYSGGYVGAGGSFGGYVSSGGGLVGAGGTTGCQGIAPCAPIACGPGQQQVTLPGSCCPTCQGCTGSCLVSSCPPGQRLATVPGQCCPTCTGEPCLGMGCPDPMCPPGSTQTTPPGQCCPVCTGSGGCVGVACPPEGPMCPPGSTFATPPGQCCPVCMPANTCAGVPCGPPPCPCGPPFTIDASIGPCDQSGYAQFLQKETIALDAESCTNASDCVVLPMPTACSPGCGTAANVKSWKLLYGAAQQYGGTNCSACPPSGSGDCAAYSPTCVNGQCQRAITGPLN